ncbi:glycosyltransferase family 39 protein [Novosphingobium flavum]|uniref:glycosyltransferase family 39 protein n=1 Tax=Novosphingobium aerophilum TaxID=2839843 RepID=UPI001639C0D7|nr:glycosyltransferase family 39 protein [Novosphingobium aerophilum]MBC2661601.1 glycosyltransferase family 39 protein [Novosphingobium aerophilum]
MAPLAGSSPTRAWLRRLPGWLVLIAAALLLLRTGLYLTMAAGAVRFPYQLDYGEGIVWEQLRRIATGRGYAPIEGFPTIVFHYPPLYHALTGALVRLTGADALLTGRALSFACTLITAGLVARIAALLAPREVARWMVWSGSGMAALIALGMLPTSQWSVLMRVDMLCMALTFGGLLCGMLALTRPRAVYLAALLFVAAVYTKQTALAAPAAVFGVLLITRPRTALAGIAATIALGLAALAALTVQTDGGFLRHIVLYNINRVDLTSLRGIPQNIVWHFGFVLAAVAGALGLINRLRESRLRLRAPSWREHLAAVPDDARAAIALLHLALATLMLGMKAKSGAADNYLIEWDCLLALCGGLALTDLLARSFGSPRSGRLPGLQGLLVPGALVSQLMMHPVPDIWPGVALRAHTPEAARLVAMIKAAPRPVISDDMVAVLRAGKPVLIEPAIVTELAAKGVWDESPFVAQLRARRFAFVVTTGLPGSMDFDNRHSPAVTAALAEAYPVRIDAGSNYLNFPAGPLPDYVRMQERAAR